MIFKTFMGINMILSILNTALKVLITGIPRKVTVFLFKFFGGGLGYLDPSISEQFIIKILT